MLAAPRADLFRLLGDEDRLRLLALCAEEELTVGELATLLGESQPQVTQEVAAAARGRPAAPAATAPARCCGRSSTADPVVDAALDEGRALCSKDGSLARVAGDASPQREELSRRFFDEARGRRRAGAPRRRRAARLAPAARAAAARSRARDRRRHRRGHAAAAAVAALRARDRRRSQPGAARALRARGSPRWGLPNVRLREGDVEDAGLAEEIGQRGGADLVVMARVLHHAARPAGCDRRARRACCAPGGHLVDRRLPAARRRVACASRATSGSASSRPSSRAWLEAAALDVRRRRARCAAPQRPPLQLAVGQQAAAARSLTRLTTTDTRRTTMDTRTEFPAFKIKDLTPGRARPQEDPHGREGDARPDVAARGVQGARRRSRARASPAAST